MDGFLDKLLPQNIFLKIVELLLSIITLVVGILTVCVLIRQLRALLGSGDGGGRGGGGGGSRDGSRVSIVVNGNVNIYNSKEEEEDGGF